MKPERFQVELIGVFLTFHLLNEKGEYIYDMEAAAAYAEREFKTGWSCVYNGNEGVSREEWIAQQAEKS